MNAQESARSALQERAIIAAKCGMPIITEVRLILWESDIFHIATRKHEQFSGSYLSPRMGEYQPIYFHFNGFTQPHSSGIDIVAGFLCGSGDGRQLASVLFTLDKDKKEFRAVPLVTKVGDTISPGLSGLIAAREFLDLKLAANTPVLLPRNARRLIAKQNAEPPDIRLISLREREATGWHNGSDRRYKHRWITDGHWRRLKEPLKKDSKRSGGKKGDHVVWVVPHEKGPVGAPLLAHRPTVWVAHR